MALLAGLLSVPFMALLAVTGSIYLFHDGIEHTAFSYRGVAADPGTAPLSAAALLGRAVGAVPGSAPAYFIEPASRTTSAMITVKGPDDKMRVYLDPYTGGMLDKVRSDREFTYLLKKVQSLEVFDTFSHRLVGAVAGFAMVLVVNGSRPNEIFEALSVSICRHAF